MTKAPDMAMRGTRINTYAHDRVWIGGTLFGSQFADEVNMGAKSSTGIPLVVAETTSGVVAVPVTVIGMTVERLVRYPPVDGSKNENSIGGISNVPFDLGIKTYLNVLLPVN